MFLDENVIAYHESNTQISVYMSKVYSWMAGALAISALVAWSTANTPGFMDTLMANPVLFYGMMIGELVLVIALAGWVQKMSLTTAIIAFLAYSVLTGLTLSSIFLVYTSASIFKTFLITGGVFGVMSVYGYVTKKDLTSWGSFLIMSLIGMVLASLVNLFLHSQMIEWITTYAGIIIFTGLTAWDTQKLKRFGSMGMEEDMLGKMAIFGALTLYLDFINLFLSLLRAFGNRR
jgi:hypothetical protein